MSKNTKPNWVEIGTLIVAVITLMVSAVAASFAWRLDNIERQLLVFQANSEILHRLIVVPAESSCFLENNLRVQQNTVWTVFRKAHCSGEVQNPDGLRIAGLHLALGGKGGDVFTPRPDLTVQVVNGVNSIRVDRFNMSGSTDTQSLGFLEEGEEAELFVPLAVVDQQGNTQSSTVIRPISLSWQSPITNSRINIALNWFAPPDEWQAYDGNVWAQ